MGKDDVSWRSLPQATTSFRLPTGEDLPATGQCDHTDMPQFGSTTTIGLDVRLILLDCFETIVELGKDGYVPRLGMLDFLIHYSARIGIPLAVMSDGASEQVEQALKQAKVRSYFVAVYHAENAAEDLGDGRKRKKLDAPIQDFQLKPAQVVFIGDSPLDAEAAQHYGVQFIRVPRSEDRSFSFATLISGPSKYCSQEFELTFLDQYRKKGQPKR
jgi:predicted HAD superfamily phosphohydrolase YqeG